MSGWPKLVSRPSGGVHPSHSDLVACAFPLPQHRFPPSFPSLRTQFLQPVHSIQRIWQYPPAPSYISSSAFTPKRPAHQWRRETVQGDLQDRPLPVPSSRPYEAIALDFYTPLLLFSTLEPSRASRNVILVPNPISISPGEKSAKQPKRAGPPLVLDPLGGGGILTFGLDTSGPKTSLVKPLGAQTSLNARYDFPSGPKYLHHLLTTDLTPSLIPPLLSTIRTTLFPRNALPPPTPDPPSPEEQAEIRRNCAEALCSLFPDVLNRAAGLFRGDLVREVGLELDVWGDAYLNKHLAYQILELVVVRILPEMGEKGVKELMEARGIDSM
ncbi:MAG: hypothetical protein L6R40_005932 [Gallowayella cf. fulva]|nr:MAG: hypothetical protein L6R40_005932 [Xanthomendoza cf. fulva]